MKTHLSDNLYDLTTKLMMTRERREVMSIVGEFLSTIDKLAELEKNGSGNGLKPKVKADSYILKFTQKEIQDMAKTFKKEFIANGLAAHVIKRESGRNSYCYEIRYRSNGYTITASSTDLSEAKRKFLAKTTPKEIDKYCTQKTKNGIKIFETVFEEWYRFRSQTKVTKKVLDTHKKHFYSLPVDIQKKPVVALTMEDIATCLNGLADRMYEEYRTLFNMLLNFAIANGYITNNPLSLIPFTRAKRNHREALSEEEIADFLVKIRDPKFDEIRQMAYFYYFFGLRASELDEETRREGDFIITRNRKRKNGKIEYKKIPIPKEAETLIDWTYPLHRNINPAKAGKLFHDLLGQDKSAYNFRHTFSTLCQQKVRQEIVEIWIGDSPQRLIGKVYTHFSDKFMREEMDKVIFPVFESLKTKGF